MELLVVLIILVAVGGLMISSASNPTVRGTDGSVLTPNAVVTRATMQEVIKALVGDGADASNYYRDNFSIPNQLTSLFINVDELSAYNPVTKTGWNGPYLLDSGADYGTVTRNDDSDGFTDLYALEDDPVVLDSWGRPLVLQESSDRNSARLVSAGPNRILEMDPDDLDADPGDDIVKFLF